MKQLSVPRPEYPRPQFRRERWQNLNGVWAFAIDQGKSGESRGLHRPDARYGGQITVPFCPESRLSGVEHTDFLNAVWYKRTVEVGADDLTGRAFLHFGAVDHTCTVYLNGKRVGTHVGGYVSFCFEVTDFLRVGENDLTVCAADDVRDPMVPRGKQSEEYASHGCDYTRTTGIWQTVWLEYTPKAYLVSVRQYPDARGGSLTLCGTVRGRGSVEAVASYAGREVGRAKSEDVCGAFTVSIPLSETHLWEVGAGRLYDLRLTFGEDVVESYFALRSVGFDADGRFLLNGKPVFQRLVLDQGFYPDGVYTAPTDADLLRDVRLAKALGFNGARLHQKVFEERFLYHCDREGYLVWGEYASWGLDHTRPEGVYGFLPEWIAELERDCNHPAIVGWCPFNETWNRDGRKQYDPLLSLVYRVTRAVDPTRPCIDTSGNFHVETDVFDLHDYGQDPSALRERYAPFASGGELADGFRDRQTYGGQPVFLSEYGGIRWSEGNPTDGWGYGDTPKTKREFLERLRGLTDALLDNPRLFGFCYTQLTDIEQEQNGLYTDRREPKLDVDAVRAIFLRKAACEEA